MAFAKRSCSRWPSVGLEQPRVKCRRSTKLSKVSADAVFIMAVFPHSSQLASALAWLVPGSHAPFLFLPSYFSAAAVDFDETTPIEEKRLLYGALMMSQSGTPNSAKESNSKRRSSHQSDTDASSFSEDRERSSSLSYPDETVPPLNVSRWALGGLPRSTSH